MSVAGSCVPAVRVFRECTCNDERKVPYHMCLLFGLVFGGVAVGFAFPVLRVFLLVGLRWVFVLCCCGCLVTLCLLGLRVVCGFALHSWFNCGYVSV